MSQDVIEVQGAREHNLKNLSLKIPRNRLTVITGLSGSGKSSLAFDTIYAEGQRRYLESLSSYARQFLEKLKKPDVDYISGLSPAIAIEQRSISHNPRSTVATVTEIFDYLRLLYAKAGMPYCHGCGTALTLQGLEDICKEILKNYENREIQIFAPMVRGRKGEFQKLFQAVLKKGFSKARIDGNIRLLTPQLKLRKTQRHDIEILIDHTKPQAAKADGLRQSLHLAADLTGGALAVLNLSDESKGMRFFSTKRSCPQCQISYPELTPNMFSFNSPYGACPRCKGLGKLTQMVAGGIIRDDARPLMSGALNQEIFFSFNKYFVEDLLYDLTKKFHFDWNLPFRDWPEEAREVFFWGDGDHTGFIEELERLFHETSSEEIRRKVRKFLREDTCDECHGKRLRKESLSVLIGGRSIIAATEQAVECAVGFFNGLDFPEKMRVITEPILKEIRERLSFLLNVGLGYLTLDRTVATLAGGELQRIRLAAQIGVGLTGVLYVLDEPSIGLHPRDNGKLLDALEKLRDMKNTVLVVEHDEETMRRADHLIDLGPGAGRHGGELVAQGHVRELDRQSDRSLTAKYLTGALKIPVPKERKDYRPAGKLCLKGCEEHNLKKIDVEIPLGLFVCVTGVSGSGKSTLVHDILYKELHNRVWKTHYPVGRFRGITGAEKIDKVIEIDQSPIGRTPRSNPATYTDLFGFVRKLFSELQESRVRRYTASRFSFNLKGGRCEKCRGEGYEKLQMSFMPDLYVVCESCNGARYNDATLEVRYRGKNIAEVLDLSVDEAIEFFDAFSAVRERLVLLQTIGLGYLKLGQSSTTLSGGEAQRIKLASELNKKATGKTVYLLDEPTTGLHFADVENLLKALFQLRDQGNTILVIEHQLDVIKMADYLIDLGPEGGDRGGRVVATGTPEEVAAQPDSYTGMFLKKVIP
ncbi:MAG: excinuclease ABC subunit UvrA [Candidatus Omnitrophica bacterium]|nr:excinuclease ABC subunit UvrA [Candidatus Omnitrophota bacterium]MDD5671575.1 excinuclease ABC subunit UvrA [Candidatus Omnitrophota bacterium]